MSRRGERNPDCDLLELLDWDRERDRRLGDLVLVLGRERDLDWQRRLELLLNLCHQLDER